MARTKRIYCLIDSLASGGAQRQMVGLASLLQNAGYVVRVVTYYDIPFYKSFLKENRVDYESLTCGKGPINRLFAIRRSIKRFKPDVVISYLDIPCILACLLKSFSKGWKLVVSERNTTQKESIRDIIKFLLYRYADCIVSNSYSQNVYITTHHRELEGKCKVITNFVDTNYFYPGKGNINDRELRIIGVGRILRQKNIPVLIKAVKSVIDKGHRIHVDWYGAKFESYEECQNLIEQQGLEHHFEFHEPYNSIVEKYQCANLFVLPSIYEGFPNVLCEAMSCGLPAIVSDICDNGIIMKQGENGYLFNPTDAEQLSDLLIRFDTLPKEQKDNMAKRSREIAVEEFSSSSFVKKYIEIIEFED